MDLHHPSLFIYLMSELQLSGVLGCNSLVHVYALAELQLPGVYVTAQLQLPDGRVVTPGCVCHGAVATS